MRRRLVPRAALLLLAATACSAPPRQPPDADTPAARADSAAPTAAPPIALPDTAALPAAFAGDTQPVEGGDGGVSGAATLVAVRTAADAGRGFERLVLELEGATLPPYRVAYASEPPTQCGSGRPVPVAGGAVLLVHLHRTRVHAERGGEMVPTVTERDRRLGQPAMRQLTLTCDFEGETEWALGLAGRRPFRVLELPSPTRLVVDVASGPPPR
jgi:hypothetical protein